MERFVALSCLVVACGGQVAVPDAGDGSAVDGQVVDGGFSSCVAPGGSTLCGEACGSCADCTLKVPSPSVDAGDTSVLRICNAKLGRSCVAATDGNICAFEDTAAPASGDPSQILEEMDVTDPEVGYLYHLNGRDDVVRYADRAAYDGTTLPTLPTACPMVEGLPLCAGACGGCPTPKYPTTGYTCTGRSPRHPFSLCVNNNGFTFRCVRDPAHVGACPAQLGPTSCFTFQVDGASQTIADQNSFMIDSSACAAAATSYPGGGYCTCPQ